MFSHLSEITGIETLNKDQIKLPTTLTYSDVGEKTYRANLSNFCNILTHDLEHTLTF